jgi:hypothetical protein
LKKLILKQWLEEAISQERISIAEAININRSSDPDWEFLIRENQLTFERARKVLQLRESRKIEIAEAFACLDQAVSKKVPTEQVSTKQVVDTSESQNENSRHGDLPFTKGALEFLKTVDSMRKRPAIEQLKFFISGWEKTLLLKRSPVSDGLAAEIYQLVQDAKKQTETFDDQSVLRRAKPIIEILRARRQIPGQRGPRPISIPTGGQHRRR